ncbi:phosphatidylserine decarboxylase [Desulfobotulus mexicanus]|nr:phosphatidylserine decarboxylase [Desulfobotulus mexicanus]
MFFYLSRMKSILIFVCLVATLILASSSQASYQPNTVYLLDEKHEPITQQLIIMLEYNPELKGMLLRSIDMAKKINPDRATNPAQSLEDYYDFINWAAKAMPWTILPSAHSSSLYEQIDQSLNYFYFINDQPLPELKGKGYFNNSLQYHEPYRSWLILFTKQWGRYLGEEESWNEEYYKLALADDRFGLAKGWYEDPSNWKSFNDFFARYLKSPDQRPIALPGDASVVTAPADSRHQGEWKIDHDSNIVHHGGVVVKSSRLKSIPALLGEDNPYKNAFAKGTFTHIFLDVNDYHRYHFPVSGVIRHIGIIKQDNAAGGITYWDPEIGKYILESINPGWQNIQTRGVVIIDTEEYGLVAVIPVGMSQVSSVNFEESINPGDAVRKGDPLGYFLFGGSNIIFLFQSKVEFKLSVPKEACGTEYKHLLMGEEYGKLSPVK